MVNKLVTKIKNFVPRNYQVVHEEYDDKRGIEVGFIYDASKFEIAKHNQTGKDLVFSHQVLREEATRNVLQVNFRIKTSGT